MHASNSRWAYAQDPNIWFRFPWEAFWKASPWAAMSKDIAEYHPVRYGDGAEVPIARSTWNRAVAALDHLYGHAVKAGFVESRPFVLWGTRRAVRHEELKSGSSKRCLREWRLRHDSDREFSP